MSKHSRSALCGHPVRPTVQLADTPSPNQQRPSPRSRSYCSFLVPLRVGGQLNSKQVELYHFNITSRLQLDLKSVNIKSDLVNL